MQMFHTRLSPWVAVRGLMHGMERWDWMHTGPLGTCKLFAGSLLIFLLEGRMLGERRCSDDFYLRTVLFDARAWCSQHKLGVIKGPVSIDSLGRQNRQKYPELSSKWKAYPAQLFTQYLCHLAMEKLACADDWESNLVKTCCWAWATAVSIKLSCLRKCACVSGMGVGRGACMMLIRALEVSMRAFIGSYWGLVCHIGITMIVMQYVMAVRCYCLLLACWWNVKCPLHHSAHELSSPALLAGPCTRAGCYGRGTGGPPAQGSDSECAFPSHNPSSMHAEMCFRFHDTVHAIHIYPCQVMRIIVQISTGHSVYIKKLMI